MSHKASKTSKGSFLRRHLKLSSACHWYHKALQHSASLRGRTERDWLYRIGCEVKVSCCCLINLLSVSLLVCYEIKVNSDEVIKEYLGGQRLARCLPAWAQVRGGSSPRGLLAGDEILLSLLQCQAQGLGAGSAWKWIRLIPGPWQLSFLEYFQ